MPSDSAQSLLEIRHKASNQHSISTGSVVPLGTVSWKDMIWPESQYTAATESVCHHDRFDAVHRDFYQATGMARWLEQHFTELPPPPKVKEVMFSLLSFLSVCLFAGYLKKL